MIDRAAAAAFPVEHRHLSLAPADLWDEMCCRWPGITDDEAVRGAGIAAELLAIGILEQMGEADRLRPEVHDLRRGARAP